MKVRCTTDHGWTHEGRIVERGEVLELDEATAAWIVTTMRAGEYVTDAPAPADESAPGKTAKKAKGA